MTLIDRIKHWFAAADPVTVHGQAPVAYGNGYGSWLERYKEDRDSGILKNYRDIYRKGGVVRTALDCYVQFMLSAGWTLQNDKMDGAQQQIMDLLFGRTCNYDTVIQEVLTDAICIGDGFALILTGSGSLSNTPVGLQHLPAERVKIVVDASMTIVRYDLMEMVGSTRRLGSYLPEQVLHLCLFPDGSSRYGVGLMESAIDEIQRDTTISDSTAAAIRRHGFGIWHAKVSSNNPMEPISPADVTAVVESLKKIGAKSEIVTSSSVEILPLNETGQANITVYNDWSLLRLCTALGVPGELLGVRQGTTDATAVTRIENYYKKIRALQKILSVAINTQFIDRTLVALGHGPGIVWIEYADPSPEDSLKRAQYITAVAAATPGDPFALMSRRQQQVYLGIDPDEWEKDENGSFGNEDILKMEVKRNRQ